MTDEKIKLQARQARFLRDPVPVRLANLASNLARLKSFAAHPAMSDAARRVVYESKHFIEWTATDATLAVQVELLAVQRQLAQWQMGWGATWNDEERRQSIASCAERWAQQFLASSGLLNNSPN
jgi:hypothetical protein